MDSHPGNTQDEVSLHSRSATDDAPQGPAHGLRLTHIRGYTGNIRKIGLPIGLALLLTVFSLLSDRFLTVSTFRNIAVQSSINMIVGIGQAVVIMGSGIDLSVGALVAVCAVVLADQLAGGVSAAGAVGIALLVGVLFGLVNAALIVFGRLAPFIATLGTLSAYRGIALLYTDGQPIYGAPAGFRSFFAGSVVGIPSAVFVAALVALVVHVMIWHTQIGRHILAVGGNEAAARIAGINSGQTKAVTYALSGVTAALAACVLVARVGAAEPIAASGLELTAIAVAVIGGSSLSGGKGSIIGAVLGAFIIGTLLAGLTMLNVQAFWQLVAIGVVIILAVLTDPKRV